MTHSVLILAKKGSVGLPGKNLLKFNNVSLLENTYNQVQSAGCFNAIFLTTNCSELMADAERLGIQVIRRSDELAANARYVDSVNHAVEKIAQFSTTVTIPQIVQPLRSAHIFERMIAMHDNDTDSVVTVKPFESSVDWIFQAEENMPYLERPPNVTPGNVMGRQSNLFEIDNNVVSFTIESWRDQDGATAWPYLGKRIKYYIDDKPNKNLWADINDAEDWEWLNFLLTFEGWKEKC